MASVTKDSTYVLRLNQRELDALHSLLDGIADSTGDSVISGICDAMQPETEYTGDVVLTRNRSGFYEVKDA